MGAYNKVVVGTDGSESSLRAVDRAGALAGDSELILACAYLAESADPGARDALREESYQLSGSNPAEDILRTAKSRAAKAGATAVTLRAIQGPPVEALLKLVRDTNADLLVIGNKGLNSLTGRLLGSVPSDAARRSVTDVLIVHTT